jgi:DNA-binding NarL/FixJ family response regulator
VRLSDELIGNGLKVVVRGITKPEWGKRSRKGDLSEREGEVLALIATGQTNREIGKSLGISIKTVEKHRQSVMKKAHVRETAGLTRLAIRRGYVQVQK